MRQESRAETEREERGREQQSFQIENGHVLRHGIAEQGRQKQQEQDDAENRQVGNKLPDDIARARDRLGKHQRPFLFLRLGAADAGEQREERNEIERDLHHKERDRVRILAEEDRSQSTEERQRGEDLKIAIDERGSKLAQQDCSERCGFNERGQSVVHRS